ncbi:MAG: AlpA family phage regulatory protein [Planctomycetaceae bacterium]|nr:AlpA family phage regulatory protein [Planctomycetaceae bacterium]
MPSEPKAPPPEVRPMLAPKTIAKRMGISSAWLHKMIKAGTFPQPIRISQRVLRWDAEVVESWLRSRAS